MGGIRAVTLFVLVLTVGCGSGASRTTASPSATQPPKPELEFVSDSASHFGGSYIIVGEIRNNFESSCRYVTVYVTVYDSSNRTIAQTMTYTGPPDIKPGSTAGFRLSVGDSRAIDHYRLAADSSNKCSSLAPPPSTPLVLVRGL